MAGSKFALRRIPAVSMACILAFLFANIFPCRISGGEDGSEQSMKTTFKSSIQLLRNATLIIHYDGKKILVDPMLTAKGTLDARIGTEKNPTAELPMPVNEIVEGVDLVLVTHTHRDHFDSVASSNLNKSIRLIGQPADRGFFEKEGFINAEMIESSAVWNGITITRTEAQHGSGEVLKKMGKASGFVLQADDQPTVFILGDTIWTEDVKRDIQRFSPDWIVVNSGGAVFPGAESNLILMDENQTMAMLEHSGKAKVIAVHMDVLSHCLTSREMIRQKAKKHNINATKLIVPTDGDIIQIQ